MMHSRLLRISLFMIVVKPFASVSIDHTSLFVFFEPQFHGSFPEAVPAQVQIVTPNYGSIGAASNAWPCALAIFSFFFNFLFRHIPSPLLDFDS
jgi:hypothetical protein